MVCGVGIFLKDRLLEVEAGSSKGLLSEGEGWDSQRRKRWIPTGSPREGDPFSYVSAIEVVLAYLSGFLKGK